MDDVANILNSEDDGSSISLRFAVGGIEEGMDLRGSVKMHKVCQSIAERQKLILHKQEKMPRKGGLKSPFLKTFSQVDFEFSASRKWLIRQVPLDSMID